MTKFCPNQIRVNCVDYPDGIKIECYRYWCYSHWNRGPSWAVPAWDEIGLSCLKGPFADVAEAERVLDEELDYINDCGYTTVATYAGE